MLLKVLVKTMGDDFIVKKSAVYNCVGILKQRHEGCENDFAVIRLDRKVTDRIPLKIRHGNMEKMADDARLIMIGYPNADFL